MATSFLDDFSGDLFKNTIVKELQAALDRAIKSSPKSIITAHYPQKDYDAAVFRMHVQANLEAIRKNPDNKKAIRIYADGIFEDGTSSADIEPDFAQIEMSYTQFSKLTTLNFCQDVVNPLLKRMLSWDKVHDIAEERAPFNAFDGVPEEPKPKKAPVTLKCEVELKSFDESVEGEMVVEPTRQKMRAMFLKSTTNANKYKFFIRSTLEEKKYDCVEINYTEEGLSVSIIKGEAVEQTKFVTDKVAYKIVTEYIKGEDIDIDTIEQDVLSQPPKQKTNQQPTDKNNNDANGCLTALVIVGLIFLFFVLPRLLAN